MLKPELGRRAEDEAVLFLKKNGYKIVARNVRTELGEIDIVARDRGVLCFVEVRSRCGKGRQEEALASVDERKQRQLSRLAVAFLKNNRLTARRARFDVVSVTFSELGTDILLLKDAFPVSGKYR